MRSSVKFIGWKLAELLIWIFAFPFLFIGSWSMEASDWCHDRAVDHDPARASHRLAQKGE